MSSACKKEASVKVEANSNIKEEESVFIIDASVEEKPDLAIIRPLKLEVDSLEAIDSEPGPSVARAVAEVRVGTPPPAPIKYEDPFALAPRARFSPPPPPADRAKRRSVPGGHDSARPRLKYLPYQARR